MKRYVTSFHSGLLALAGPMPACNGSHEQKHRNRDVLSARP
jgi:hypothetical protein